jgi:hypothetical protein
MKQNWHIARYSVHRRLRLMRHSLRNPDSADYAAQGRNDSLGAKVMRRQLEFTPVNTEY